MQYRAQALLAGSARQSVVNVTATFTPIPCGGCRLTIHTKHAQNLATRQPTSNTTRTISNERGHGGPGDRKRVTLVTGFKVVSQVTPGPTCTTTRQDTLHISSAA